MRQGRWPALVAAALVVAACSGEAAPTRGETLARDVGCLACHFQGSDLAPTWEGLWGSEVELADGRTVIADADYVRRSIQEPSADVRAGYEPTMPLIPLTEAETEALVDYIRSRG
ncbi:MAG: hypothetical protein ACLFWM_14865 [Actinomycetota bacterium]